MSTHGKPNGNASRSWDLHQIVILPVTRSQHSCLDHQGKTTRLIGVS